MKRIIEHIVVDDKTIDTNDPFQVIDPVFWVVNIYEGEEKYNDSLAQFSLQQRLINAVGWYLSEVNNGGHYQFYDNSTGIVWKDAMVGLKEIGLADGLSILSKSISRLGGEPSLDRETRQKQLKTYNPDFSDLDEELYALERTINIDAPMMQYIRTHSDAFFFDGDVQMWTSRK